MRDTPIAWAQVKDLVALSHFQREDHRIIFGEMLTLIGRVGVVDPILLIDGLGEQLNAAGGSDYIAQLYEDCPAAGNARAYAQTLRDYAGRGKVIDIGAQLQARSRLGGSATAIAAYASGELQGLERDYGAPVEPLSLEPVSAWAAAPEPAARDWVIEGLIPAGKVSSLLGNGGLGKTLVALQIGLHVSLGRPLFGIATSGGPVLGIFCEDDEDELNRRVRSACAAERVNLSDAERFIARSREGLDSTICTFEREHIRIEEFHRQLDATIAVLRPRLVILDTAADMFAGEMMSTPQVRQFLKIALGGLCARYGCAVLLLAHPSKAGQSSGEGDGFSTAWSNSVRSRLYLRAQRAPAVDGIEPVDEQDRRMLEVKKTNYGKSGVKIPLLYQSGSYVLDPEPVEQLADAPRTKTARLAIGALDYIRARSPLSVGFRDLFNALQGAGDLPPGPYDQHRKTLSRALKQLVSEGLLTDDYPRGYCFNRPGTS